MVDSYYVLIEAVMQVRYFIGILYPILKGDFLK